MLLLKFILLVLIPEIARSDLQNATEGGFWWHKLGSQISQNTRQLEKFGQDLQKQNVVLQEISDLMKNATNLQKQQNLPKNCLDVKNRGYNKSDIYLIQPLLSPRPFLVKCEMVSNGGGWTLLLNRFDGSINFNINWANYKEGFGNLGTEFWLGLNYLYYLTGEEVNVLLIEFADADMKEKYARYEYFSIGSEQQGYYLKLVSGFTGNVENRMVYHSGQKFTTSDKDQDSWVNNCAQTYTGGWWYGACHGVHLTGTFGAAEDKGATWVNRIPVKYAKMMVRPRDK